MPFSILMQGIPIEKVPVPHVQGPALQGMFLHLLKDVAPTISERLHHENTYRPYTLSPLGIGTPGPHFQGFRLPRHNDVEPGTPCYLRITLLEDQLFPIFSTYFLTRPEPTFRLGSTTFNVTDVRCSADHATPWSLYQSYSEMIEHSSRHNRNITLHFLTPTSFRRGNVDFPLPDPRLVFRSYRQRFEEFYQVAFLPEFDEQVDYYTGVADLHRVHTARIATKRVSLIGFTGKVSYFLDRKAPPELIFQMNLLADYAFFCGTGRKTTVGMGQTIRIK